MHTAFTAYSPSSDRQPLPATSTAPLSLSPSVIKLPQISKHLLLLLLHLIFLLMLPQLVSCLYGRVREGHYGLLTTKAKSLTRILFLLLGCPNLHSHSPLLPAHTLSFRFFKRFSLMFKVPYIVAVVFQ